jgi:tetratricopeptide (TPR) repeat protein
MGDDFNLDKELAPATRALVSGNVEGATAALAAVLVKFATGSSAAAAGAEALVARAIALSSDARLKNAYQELEQEEKEAALIAHIAGSIHRTLSGDVSHLKTYLGDEFQSVRSAVAFWANDVKYEFRQEVDRIIAALGSLHQNCSAGPLLSGPRIHLPYRSIGTLFKGRDQSLTALSDRLTGDGAVSAITQVPTIHGLGGVGKTRLAVEYVWRYQDRYDFACLIRADSPQALHTGLVQLTGADCLDLKEFVEQPEPLQVQAVLGRLMQRDRWILVLDNVDDEAAANAVDRILPKLAKGHVIITSRLSRWGPAYGGQPLDALDHQAAVRFILERSHQRDQTSDDEAAADRLVATLDRLPLALEQAAAYINCEQSRITDYLDAWETERETLLSWADQRLTKYPHAISVTWKQTYDRLSPMAQTLLKLCAFFAPSNIPIKMLESQIDLIQEALALHAEASEPTDIKKAVAELTRYSMAQKTGQTLAVHKLVQEVLQLQIPEKERAAWVEKAVTIVNNHLPSEPPPQDVRSWPIWEQMRPHVEQIIAHAESIAVNHPTSVLMNELAKYLFINALYADAEPLMRRALKIDEAAFGESHPTVAIYLNNLAQLLKDTNRLKEAEPLMRRALQIDEEAFGESHPDVAIDLDNLAQLLQATNRLKEAEPLMRRALQIDEAAFGEFHPRVASHLNNLAQLLQDTNRLKEAEPLMRRALQIDEEALGETHPDVARDLNNLATLLQATNRLKEAEPLMLRALKIDEDALGEAHPTVARDLNNLARLLQDTNRMKEAEPLMLRALKIAEDALGEAHPVVAIRLNNLARLLQDTNRLKEAEPLMRRALKIFEASLGTEHPYSMGVRQNLDILLDAMKAPLS